MDKAALLYPNFLQKRYIYLDRLGTNMKMSVSRRCSARISRTGSTLARSNSRSGTDSATSACIWTFAHAISTQPVSQPVSQPRSQEQRCLHWLTLYSCVLFACCASQRSQARLRLGWLRGRRGSSLRVRTSYLKMRSRARYRRFYLQLPSLLPTRSISLMRDNACM